jgi:hypothetical protein
VITLLMATWWALHKLAHVIVTQYGITGGLVVCGACTPRAWFGPLRFMSAAATPVGNFKSLLAKMISFAFIETCFGGLMPWTNL